MDTVEHNWKRIEAWLTSHLPEVVADLNPPASASQITRVEAHFQVRFPEDLRRFYAMHNGQQGQSLGAFFGLSVMSLERILELRSISGDNTASDLDPESKSLPANTIKPWFVGAKWVPVADDGGGGYFAVDFDPDREGQVGQVINYGRAARTKVVIASNFGTFLGWMADALDQGKGRVYESAGLKLFDHADLGNGDFEECLVRVFGS
jgi:internalin A